MISVKNVYKNYGKLRVLKNVSLDVQPGEKVVIIGSSGSGKSTLLRCINLLENPTFGEVWLEDKLLTKVDPYLHNDIIVKSITFKNLMKKNPEINVTVQGHCDERGSTEYNLALGAMRAGNAAHILIRNDIEPHRIKTISYGKERPLYRGTGEEVWSKNRNATTVIRKF